MRALKGFLTAQLVVAVAAAALLIPAGLVSGGTWIWPRAWTLLGGIGLVTGAGSAWLAVYRPDNFAMRQQGPVAGRARGQPLVDAVGLVAYLAYLLAWFAFIPWDVFGLRLLPAPAPLLSAAGGVAGLFGLLLTQVAVAQNRFAAPTIHDQSAEGQRVIDTGLYAWVRHPLYAGNLLVFLGTALWLGSTAAAPGVLVMLAATLARIVIEERHLHAALPGYGDYARRVRGRLVPGVF